MTPESEINRRGLDPLGGEALRLRGRFAQYEAWRVYAAHRRTVSGLEQTGSVGIAKR